jgi:hypothetical protein
MRILEQLHPVGIWGHALDRSLAPCLSVGTLQLSIRCSSIHFRPSRSFPVSELIVFGALAPLPIGI